MRGRARQLPVLDLFRTRALRLALPLAVGVDEGIGQDPEQPRLQVRALLELVEGRVGLGEGLLDQVFRIRRVAGHPKRRGVQLIQEGQHLLLEALTALFESLRNGTHLLEVIRGQAAPGRGLAQTVCAGGYRARVRRCRQHATRWCSDCPAAVNTTVHTVIPRPVWWRA